MSNFKYKVFKSLAESIFAKEMNAYKEHIYQEQKERLKDNIQKTVSSLQDYKNRCSELVEENSRLKKENDVLRAKQKVQQQEQNQEQQPKQNPFADIFK